MDIIELLSSLLANQNYDLFFQTTMLLEWETIIEYLIHDANNIFDRVDLLNLLIICSLIVYSCKKGNKYDLYDSQMIFISIIDYINNNCENISKKYNLNNIIKECNIRYIVDMIGESYNLNSLDISIILENNIN